jgi:hypothetical protein
MWPSLHSPEVLATCTERLTGKTAHQDRRAPMQTMELFDHCFVTDVTVKHWNLRMNFSKGLSKWL